MTPDAVVVGSGPNGLAAAITLAERGRSVLVLEGADTIGGGVRTAELTLPGFQHDVCSAIHPFGVASPFLTDHPLLLDHGLEWVHPNAPVAHPLDDGSAVIIERSLDATVTGLGAGGWGYRRLIEPTVRNWDLRAASSGFRRRRTIRSAITQTCVLRTRRAAAEPMTSPRR